MSTLTHDCEITIGILGDNYSGKEFFSSELQDEFDKTRKTRGNRKTDEDSLLVDNIKFYLYFYQYMILTSNRSFFGSKIFIICINPFENINLIRDYVNEIYRCSRLSNYYYCFFLAKIERDMEKSPIRENEKAFNDYQTKIASVEGENINRFIDCINYINKNHNFENNESYFGTYTFLKYDKCAINKALKDICLKYHNKINKQNIPTPLESSKVYTRGSHMIHISTSRMLFNISRNFFSRFSRMITTKFIDNILIPFVKISSIIILVSLLGLYLTQAFTRDFVIRRVLNGKILNRR